MGPAQGSSPWGQCSQAAAPDHLPSLGLWAWLPGQLVLGGGLLQPGVGLDPEARLLCVPRSKGGDNALWADEEEVPCLQRDPPARQPPNVNGLPFPADQLSWSLWCADSRAGALLERLISF